MFRFVGRAFGDWNYVIFTSLFDVHALWSSRVFYRRVSIVHNTIMYIIVYTIRRSRWFVPETVKLLFDPVWRAMYSPRRATLVMPLRRQGSYPSDINRRIETEKRTGPVVIAFFYLSIRWCADYPSIEIQTFGYRWRTLGVEIYNSREQEKIRAWHTGRYCIYLRAERFRLVFHEFSVVGFIERGPCLNAVAGKDCVLHKSCERIQFEHCECVCVWESMCTHHVENYFIYEDILSIRRIVTFSPCAGHDIIFCSRMIRRI